MTSRTPPGRAATWVLLLLPPVSLAALIFSYIALRGLSPVDPDTGAAVRRALPGVLLLNHLGLFCLLVWFLRRAGQGLADIGWSLERQGQTVGREVLVGLLCGLGLYLLKELAADPVRQLLAGERPSFTTLFRFRPSEFHAALAAVATGLVFVEESIYRGFGLTRLPARHGYPAAVAITSVAFGFLHWGNGPAAVLFTSVWGVLLALVFIWRRNLVAGTVAHALYNLLVLLT